MAYSVSVEFSGPLFDGRADHAVADFMREALDEVARQGYANVMTNLNGSIRHPTPYYETQINIHASELGVREVNDRGVIYGWWLEGIGSRNFPVTRFRGYASFRRAKQQLEPKVVELSEHVLHDRGFLDRMNA